MGRIKIVKETVPEISTMDFQGEDYDIGGKYDPQMILVSDNYTSAEESYRLFVLPQAAESIMDYIGWSQYNIWKNHSEQGGFLIGRNYKDPDKQLNIGIVEYAIPAVHARGSAGALDISPEDSKAMYKELDTMNQRRPAQERLELVGWFHTHPNSLDVFMSGTDRWTQSRLFSGERCIALVFNPHRKLWKCFRTEECLDTKAELLVGSRLADKLGKKGLRNETVVFGR